MGTQTVGLTEIAAADASPEQAREALLAVFGQPTPDLLKDAYLALRAWAWKALDQRRRDPDLIEWSDIIKAVSVLMSQWGETSLGERLQAINELLSESIAVAERFGAVDLMKRQHVAKALEFIADNGGEVRRAAIGEHLGLEQANLTRVLNMMLAAGLIARSTLGKEAVFSLTHTGRSKSQDGKPARRSHALASRRLAPAPPPARATLTG